MSDETLLSYAQHGEDVVLWRALGHVTHGVYVDVGGWDPDQDSVTRLFYDRGWRGIDIEPVPEFAEEFRRRRTQNHIVEAAITDQDADRVVLHRFGATGLSTLDDELAERYVEAGLERTDIDVPARRLDDVLAAAPLVGQDIHFLKIDVQLSEERVLRSIDLTRWRPWVLVVEATEPNSTKTTHEKREHHLVDAGYTCTLFDGLSRYYVSAEHPELVPTLSYPACPQDNFERAAHVELRTTLAQREQDLSFAREQAHHWRAQAVGYWANAVATAQTSEDSAVRARTRAARAGVQLDRTRDELQRLRTDRNKLRAQVKRLRARLAEAEREPARRSRREQLRAAVKKVTRT